MFPARNILNGLLKFIKRPSARIRLVALHHTGPLSGRHGRCTRIRQQVNDNVVGANLKQVVSGLFESELSLLARCLADRFDGFDFKGFNNGLKVHDF
jgi:hypothetical protein